MTRGRGEETVHEPERRDCRDDQQTATEGVERLHRANLPRPVVYAGGGAGRVGETTLADVGWRQLFSRDRDGPWSEPRTRFGLDSGAWAAHVGGKDFPWREYRDRVDRVYRLGLTPDFLVMPDEVENWEETLNLADGFCGLVPDDWPLYLALQDGARPGHVVQFMARNRVDGLLLGGSSEFKDREAAAWRGFCREWGLRFHYARAGTPRKFEHACVLEADSLDSTRIVRSLRDFRACLSIWRGERHPRLFCERSA